MPTITTVDATWDTSVSMDAAELRRADSAMFLGDGSNNGVRGGVVYHGPTSLGVTVNGSDQVTVQAGAFVVPAATGLGVYRGSLATATSAVNLSARNATNPRIDLIAIQVGTGSVATVKTIDGTPSASPSAPALPAQHIELARVTVPATGGGAVTVDSTFRAYATAIGGTLYVETSARLPASGVAKGQHAVALDTGYNHYYNGGSWMSSRGPAGVLGYAQMSVSLQSGITTLVDVTGLSVTVTVGASRRVRIVGSLHVSGSVLDDSGFMAIREGATQLQQGEALLRTSYVTLERSVIITPTAGTHTYKIMFSRNVGTGSVAVASSSTNPAFILVEDIGAV